MSHGPHGTRPGALLCTSYAGMNQIKFTGLESISAQPLRTPGSAECTRLRMGAALGGGFNRSLQQVG